uniref:SFRICE_013222 n=1 Tax=Spodoptera frugiperda TaxID=7108 RepID=A0A2H1WDV9_SPOFR
MGPNYGYLMALGGARGTRRAASTGLVLAVGENAVAPLGHHPSIRPSLLPFRHEIAPEHIPPRTNLARQKRPGFQAAESGNVEDFMRLYLSEPSRLAVRDGRGRTAAHQAAARNNTNILHFINNYGGGTCPEVRIVRIARNRY